MCVGVCVCMVTLLLPIVSFGRCAWLFVIVCLSFAFNLNVPIHMCVYVFVNRGACVYVSMRVTCGHLHMHGQVVVVSCSLWLRTYVDLKHPSIKHQRRATKLASCLADTCHRINQHVPAARQAKRIQKFLTSPAVV